MHGTRKALILTRENLKAYMRPGKRPWPVDDLLYVRLPMLSVRNYLNDGDDWPLCWTRGRPVRSGLSVCIDTLKSWQAFRGPSGIAGTARRELNRCVPGVVMSVQKWLVDRELYSLRAAIRSGETEALVKMMARAVAKVSACKRVKNPNPMLGSKVLHFFFPEFFPVWDTAWVYKTIRKLSAQERIQVDGRWKQEFAADNYGAAARRYAEYLDLMLRDVKVSRQTDVKRLARKIVSFSAKRNGHRSLQAVIDENLGDLQPVLFELCLLGKGRTST